MSAEAGLSTSVEMTEWCGVEENAVRAVEVPHSCAKSKSAHEWATPTFVVSGHLPVAATSMALRLISTRGDVSIRLR